MVTRDPTCCLLLSSSSCFPPVILGMSLDSSSCTSSSHMVSSSSLILKSCQSASAVLCRASCWAAPSGTRVMVREVFVRLNVERSAVPHFLWMAKSAAKRHQEWQKLWFCAMPLVRGRSSFSDWGGLIIGQSQIRTVNLKLGR